MTTAFPGKVPELWPDTCYIRPIRRETSGRTGATHLAELRGPDGGLRRGFVKHYNTAAPRGLFNEWFGYTVLSAIGVPQPEAAIMLAPMNGDGQWAYAFVSMFPGPRTQGTPKQIYDLASPQHYEILKKRIMDCPAMPCLIVADQLINNGDRNLGNFVFTGPDQFVAIDQGECLGGSGWQLADLWFSQRWARSKLIEDLMPVSALTGDFCAKLLAAADVVEETFFAMQQELRTALGADQNNDVHVALNALWWRCLQLRDRFKELLGVLT